MKENYYVVEQVPWDMVQEAKSTDKGKWVRPWYCHMKGFNYIPVFGSIGTKQHAEKVCRNMNTDGKVRYE